MVKTEEMIDFVEKVMEMRRVQKEFFKTRNYAAMQLSKSLEKDIDDRAKKLMSQLKAMEQEEQDAQQPGLFGEEANA